MTYSLEYIVTVSAIANKENTSASCSYDTACELLTHNNFKCLCLAVTENTINLLYCPMH